MKDKKMLTRASKPRGNGAVLRDFALAYPGAHEDFPWGERVVKVKGKVFVFLGRDEEGLGLAVKLPRSRLMALGLPFASPTPYGLGKSGWVSAQFGAKEQPPMDVLRAWIDESYRAVAPKRLLAALDSGTSAGPRSAKAKPKRGAPAKARGAATRRKAKKGGRAKD
jgi:predicted DNA-binding protein (MmcQ/YjbR family)